VLGASSALGDHLVTHPGHWRAVTEATRQSAAERRGALVSAVTHALRTTAMKGAMNGARSMPALNALRVAYRRNLLEREWTESDVRDDLRKSEEYRRRPRN